METIKDEHLVEIVLERARILALETGQGMLESISLILTQASIRGKKWLENESLVFPWDN